MKLIIKIIVIALLFSNQLSGQSSLAVSLIPDSLKKNADAVIRYHNTTYTRTSVNRYQVEVSFAITILNKSGKRYADLEMYYDRNSTVTGIKGTAYNESGIRTGKLKQKDIKDVATNSSYTLFSDNRLKYFSPAINAYPFTVEYQYTVKYSALDGLDSWLPHHGYNTSVQHAQLTFNTPEKLDIKYKELNYPFNAKISSEEEYKKFHWEVDNLKAVEYEPYSPPYFDVFPAIWLAPDEFGYEGTHGSCESWNSYGKWGYSLIKDRAYLPEETVLKMKELTDTLSSNREKIEAVYKYMQQKTRYVNIALGIGGFQPIKAEDVDEKGYGDCKALSNYTKALLAAIGIESYYTEIGAKKNQHIKFTDFPSMNQTNHIILCVPDKSDTIWLECTNQKIPFNYLGTGTAGKYALLITEDGGRLVRTPQTTKQENLRSASLDFVIQENGSADFNLNMTYSNLQYEGIFGLLHDSEKDKKKALLKGLSAEGIQIQDFSITDNSTEIAKGILTVSGTISNYAVNAGKRIVFTPNYLIRTSMLDFIHKNREIPLYHEYGYTYADTLTLHIPKNYTLEYKPSDLELSTIYGDCSYTFTQNGQDLHLFRKITINKGTYALDQFDEINNFLKKISSHEKEKLIIIQSENLANN